VKDAIEKIRAALLVAENLAKRIIDGQSPSGFVLADAALIGELVRYAAGHLKRLPTPPTPANAGSRKPTPSEKSGLESTAAKA